ncbi:MAG: hypothetical protein AB7E85_03880 [Pseudobdellovibrionaceae bacterium]
MTLTQSLRQAFFVSFIFALCGLSSLSYAAENTKEFPPPPGGYACSSPGSPCGCARPPEAIDFSPTIDGVLFNNIQLVPVESGIYFRLYTTIINRSGKTLRLTAIKSPLGKDISFSTRMRDEKTGSIREEIREEPFNLPLADGAVLPLDTDSAQYLTIKADKPVTEENSSVPIIFHFADHRDITVTAPLFSKSSLSVFQAKIGPDGQCQNP